MVGMSGSAALPCRGGVGTVDGSAWRVKGPWQLGQHKGSVAVHASSQLVQVFAAGALGGTGTAPSSSRQRASLVATLRLAKRP